LDEETTIQKIIERYGLPQKICHLALAAEMFVPV
jgi:hypothetical protein